MNKRWREQWLAEKHERYGGKEAYEAHMAAYGAALDTAPKPPPLHELLARFWAAYSGESWDLLTVPERQARMHLVQVEISRAEGSRPCILD